MSARWTTHQEEKFRNELRQLYVVENKSIAEVAQILGIASQTVFQRIRRLGIDSIPERKQKYLNRRSGVVIPKVYSSELAEFFGIMLGDGHLTHFQVAVTLGTKELVYAQYVVLLMHKIFNVYAKICTRHKGYHDVYLGSVELTKWLKQEGLVYNKVREQVGMPSWILTQNSFVESFLRGFFDTDGSVYKIRFGIQLAFTNRSIPILDALQICLRTLEYHPSKVGHFRVYVTRMSDIKRFFEEVQPQNLKHRERFEKFYAEKNASVPKRSTGRDCKSLGFMPS